MDKQRLVLLKNVCKEFDGVEVLSNINLYIRKNEFLTLLVLQVVVKQLCCVCLVVLKHLLLAISFLKENPSSIRRPISAN